MSTKSFAAALLAACVLLLSMACSKANAPETPKPSAASSSASTPATSPAVGNTSTNASGMKVDVKVDPTQPNPSKPAKFSAHVTDADGKPVSGAEVNVSLVMKEMDMGKNEFKLGDKGNGDYQGEGKFGMAGQWDVVVTAKQGGKTATQTVLVKSIMPKP